MPNPPMSITPICDFDHEKNQWKTEPNPKLFTLGGSKSDLDGTTPLQKAAEVLGLHPDQIANVTLDPYGIKYGHDGIQLLVTLR